MNKRKKTAISLSVVIIYTGAHDASSHEDPRASICPAPVGAIRSDRKIRETYLCLSVGAGRLDVAGLLALVANLLTTSVLLGAVTAEVAVLAAVVALGAVGTVTWDCG